LQYHRLIIVRVLVWVKCKHADLLDVLQRSYYEIIMVGAGEETLRLMTVVTVS
jgi:hypothetical protein